MMTTGHIREVRLYDPAGEYVGSMTVKPGDIIRIKSSWTNTGNSRETFLTGVSIGSPKKWYDTGFFVDRKGDYAEEVTDAGQVDSASRRIRIPDDPDVTDVWVTLKDEDKNLLDERRLSGILSVQGQSLPGCVERTYRCKPGSDNILQKCVDGSWVDWQSCAYGCDPATGDCKPAPPEPEPEQPSNIIELLREVLKDVLFEGSRVQDSLVRWNVLPKWVGSIFNKVIDLLSVNVAPAGERPLRIMFPGGSFITKQLPKISAGAADDLVGMMIREGADRITAKIAKNPAKMAIALKRLPESALIKLFQGLSASPVGRIAIFNIVKIMDVGGVEKAAKALVKADITESAAKSLYTKIGPEIGEKFYKQAGKSKYWKSIPRNMKWWVGFLGAVMGYATMNMWLAKEAVWEAPLFPIADLIRDEKWESASEQIIRLESAADFYEKTIKVLGWLSPVAMIIYKRGLKEIRANIELWRKQIDEGMAVVAPPVTSPPGVTPPVTPPGEVVPGQAWLTIKSSPAGAGIYIDGEYIYSSTNFTVLKSTRAEPYTVSLSAPRGYKNPQVKTVTILTAASQVVDFGALESLRPGEPEPSPITPPEEIEPIEPPKEDVPPTSAQSYITVTSSPPGASIWIDGENTWTVTPFSHLIEAGSHNLQLQMFRYEPVFQNIMIEGGKNIVKSYNLRMIEPVEPEKPFIPIPLPIELTPITEPVEKPTAWEYTITAKDADTGNVLSAKIIVNGIYTGKYTTNNIILEPESEYLLRLEAFGYEPGEFVLTTEALPE